MAGRTHTLDRSKRHYRWDNALPPAIEIETGDTVECETEEVTDNQVQPGIPAAKLSNLDSKRMYPLAGPIFVM
jgi:acetamidase/formamidase